jgi:hypothetical protein
LGFDQGCISTSCGDGTIDEIKRRLLQRIVDKKRLDKELWCVDGSLVRAARCAAGGGKKGTLTNQMITLEDAPEAVFLSKLHLDCDANGIPIQFELSAGQAHENSSLIELLNHSGNALVGSDGSPIAWPRAIDGDRGDRAEWIDQTASARRVKARVGRPRFGLSNRCFWVAVLSLKHHIQHHH